MNGKPYTPSSHERIPIDRKGQLPFQLAPNYNAGAFFGSDNAYRSGALVPIYISESASNDNYKHTLGAYQLVGARCLAERSRINESFLLADDMGIGKTVQFLRSIQPGERIIVTCPKVAKRVWQAETLKWRPDLRIDIKTELRRPEPNEIVCLSHHGLPLPVSRRRLSELTLTDVRVGVDEAQALMSGTAKLTKRHRLLSKQVRCMHGMTGTPMPGSPLQLWGVLMSLRIHDVAFPGFEELDPDTGATIKVTPWEQFKRLCQGEAVTIRKQVDGFWKEVKTNRFKWGNISPEVGERLKRVMLRRTKAQVLPELPPKRYQTIVVDTPDDLIPYLNEVKDKWYAIDPEKLPPFEMLAEARAAIARARIPAAVDYADDAATLERPILVFSVHRGPVEAIGALKGFAYITGDESGDDRERIVAEFQAGKLRGVAITVKSGGVALTLTRAELVLFVDLPWNPSDIEQAEDRANRKGQTKSVMVVYMMSDHPVDQRVSEILLEKKRLNREIFDQ